MNSVSRGRTILLLAFAGFLGTGLPGCDSGTSASRNVLPLKGAKCGSEQRPLSFSGIIGGQEVAANAPLAASLVWLHSTISDEDSVSCTGVLIDRDIVLTAAHCVAENVKTPQNVMVVFSPHPQCDQEKNEFISKAIQTESIHVHEGYAPEKEIENADIALIKMYRSAPEERRPLQLVSEEKSWMEYDRILLLGYGRTLGGIVPDPAPVALRAVEMTPLKGRSLEGVRNMVRRVYQSEKDPVAAGIFLDLFFDPAPLSESVWIDQTNQKGMCDGDSGGPALVLEGGEPRVAGIASMFLLGESWEQACMVASRYTNVLKYKKWISRKQAELAGRDRQNPDLDHRDFSTDPVSPSAQNH